MQQEKDPKPIKSFKIDSQRRHEVVKEKGAPQLLKLMHVSFSFFFFFLAFSGVLYIVTGLGGKVAIQRKHKKELLCIVSYIHLYCTIHIVGKLHARGDAC